MNDWLENVYIYGDYEILASYLIAKFPDPDPGREGHSAPPGEIANVIKSGLKAREQTGTVTDSETGEERSVFADIDGRSDMVFWCSVRTDAGVAIIDEVESLEGVVVHRGATVEEIRATYPEHTTGQVVPHNT